jgi:trimeric autotransporter adhesin
MKNIIIIFACMQLTSLALHAQTHYGTNAGTLGAGHTYFGSYAGASSTSTSSHNSFFGAWSGRNTTGTNNTAFGYRSLQVNTVGNFNTAAGHQSLYANTTGERNVAIGENALYKNTSGGDNTANGSLALYSNLTGINNTAIGNKALYKNSVGNQNVAIGNVALWQNKGNGNTAAANSTLSWNMNGSYNSAFGSLSLFKQSGSHNSAFGDNASSDHYNFEPTQEFPCTGSNNSSLGALTGTYFDTNCTNFRNSTAIGDAVPTTASNQIRIGNGDMTSIGGQVAWSTLSDGRFKKNIKNNIAGLEFINQLTPVSYVVDKERYNKFLGIPDSVSVSVRQQVAQQNRRQIGFIAQDVEAIIKKSGYVFSGIDAPQGDRDTYTIRYAEFVVPLVKAIQELSALNEAREKEITTLQTALRKFKEDEALSENKRLKAELAQNNPNPFSTTTDIKIELPDDAKQATLTIYNLEGKQLQNIPVTDLREGSVRISRNDLNAGIYLYALTVDGKVVDTKRLILTK